MEAELALSGMASTGEMVMGWNNALSYLKNWGKSEGKEDMVAPKHFVGWEGREYTDRKMASVVKMESNENSAAEWSAGRGGRIEI